MSIIINITDELKYTIFMVFFHISRESTMEILHEDYNGDLEDILKTHTKSISEVVITSLAWIIWYYFPPNEQSCCSSFTRVFVTVASSHFQHICEKDLLISLHSICGRNKPILLWISLIVSTITFACLKNSFSTKPKPYSSRTCKTFMTTGNAHEEDCKCLLTFSSIAFA